MKSETLTYRLNDIDTVAEFILKGLKSKIVLFYGDMGSGKTTLIKALLKEMGSKDVVSSPTFSIVNEYDIENDKVFHFDFYRIESLDEAYDFGIEDYLDSNHWLFIEWPDRIKDLLPNDADTIEITTNTDNTRSLKLNKTTINLTENYAENSL
ncbi:tRNA (adenosine(37)-N6)-threonylcarbamoyltransferase complex ATPase subunit type 1 TsaE [Winogradskyella sp. A3E31]|uniref:tRNA (adenosine(37)-N6)-threonylcarbamoyltransferase complex ATPase subunit type 1 TsaE n=1 Tax=Winogradskyella sp. A3E31 TaxID=3349637 RepID=UPI00398B9771